VAGVVPGHGHRQLFGFQRALSFRPSKLPTRTLLLPPETKKAAVVSQGGFTSNYL